ncbi:MAG: DUF1501 domain-containing protein [Caldilineae bacterium]|nr:MAG: DUF1501 domain-containing protein [Caldilineae bacterium]
MNNPTISRRGFLVGCSAAIAAMAGAKVSHVAFGSPEEEPNQEVLLVVFLRGGMDGLSVVAPLAGDDRGYYEAARERLALPTTGDNKAIDLDGFFGLHPAAAPFYDLYQAGHAAIIHAAGLTSDTRSHFDAMQFIELGTPGRKGSTTGWLTRHLLTASNIPDEIIAPAIAASGGTPTSLLGSRESIGMTTPKDFTFNGHWRYSNWHRMALRKMYTGSTWLHQAGIQTLNAIDVIEYADPGSYTPENGAEYPNGSFGSALKTVAQMIKMQLGMRIATIDLGGWDTHEYQGDAGTGYFANKVAELAQGLNALMTDLSNVNGTDHSKRLTAVVQSEFGRSFKENASRGTDHGHGNIMFVVGGGVNGGKVYGQWPGLHVEQLYDHRDLDITTDYRRVLSEILIRRLGNPHLGTIFPGYTGYEPLGVVQGEDLAPVYEPVNPTPTPTATPTPDPGGNSGPKPYNIYLPYAQR